MEKLTERFKRLTENYDLLLKDKVEGYYKLCMEKDGSFKFNRVHYNSRFFIQGSQIYFAVDAVFEKGLPDKLREYVEQEIGSKNIVEERTVFDRPKYSLNKEHSELVVKCRIKNYPGKSTDLFKEVWDNIYKKVIGASYKAQQNGST